MSFTGAQRWMLDQGTETYWEMLREQDQGEWFNINIWFWKIANNAMHFFKFWKIYKICEANFYWLKKIKKEM